MLNGPNSDGDYDVADFQSNLFNTISYSVIIVVGIVLGEASKQLAEYKFRAQKAEQDVATLQTNIARLESQVIRYKSAAEVSEKSEEALKAEKRKLQREVIIKIKRFR